MPLYEFSCRQCGAIFEELAGMKATETPACPRCASPDTVRVVSAANLRGSSLESFTGLNSPGLSQGCGSGGFS